MFFNSNLLVVWMCCFSLSDSDVNRNISKQNIDWRKWSQFASIKKTIMLSWRPRNNAAVLWTPCLMWTELCLYVHRTLRRLFRTTCWWTDSLGRRLLTLKVPLKSVTSKTCCHKFMLCKIKLKFLVLPPLTHSAEDEAVDLESQLDDTIVGTTRRRSTYPRKILPHVVQSLKAERKLMVGVTVSLSVFMSDNVQ